MADSFILKGETVYITPDSSDAYMVTRGRMLVFIVPVDGKSTGRRTFLYEAGEGETVPGLYYRDLNYKKWAFCFASAGGCEVNILRGGAGEDVRRDFTRRANVPHYDEEGFEESVVDCRRIKALAEDNFIRRSAEANSHISEVTNGIVDDAVFVRKTETIRTGEPLYDCIAYLCAKAGARIAPLRKVLEMYGKDYTIYDVARISDFACREVKLNEKLYQAAKGSVRAFAKEPFITEGPGGKPMVCLRKKRRAVLYDPETGEVIPVTGGENEGTGYGGSAGSAGYGGHTGYAGYAGSAAGKAYYITRTLPSRKLETGDIAAFCAKSIRPVYMIVLCAAVLLCAAGAFLLPLKGGELLEAALPAGGAGSALKLALILTAAGAVFGLLSAIRGIARKTIAQKIEFDLQNALYHRLFHMPESFFKESDSASIAAGAAGAGKAAGTYAELVISAVSACLTGIAAVIGTFLCSAAGPAICAMILFAISLTLWAVFGKLSLKQRAEYGEKSGELSSHLYQFIDGVEEIRGAGAEDHVLYELMRSYAELNRLSEKYRKRRTLFAVISGLSGAVLLMLGLITFPAVSGAAGGGGFTAFCIYAGILLESAFHAGKNIRGLLSGGGVTGTLRHLMDQAPECGETADAAPAITGAIELSGVSFRYSDDSPMILENVNLSIKAGEYVAIAGPSGCGKSTLVRLLLGFVTPTSGRIYYDNIDLGSIDRNRLRASMGVVLQEDKLLEGNILDNVRASRPWATEAQVRRAMDLAGLSDEVEKLPMGLMTVTGRDGGGFSHSLYRRILIARALIKNPRILIFDEADANLDRRSTDKLRAAIASMSCTRIIVTHDPESVKDCGRIITLDGSGHADCNKENGTV